MEAVGLLYILLVIPEIWHCCHSIIITYLLFYKNIIETLPTKKIKDLKKCSHWEKKRVEEVEKTN